MGISYSQDRYLGVSSSAMGYEDDDDGDGQRRRWRQATMAMAMVDDNNDVNGDSTTGNKVGNDGVSAMGNNNDNDDTSCEATTNRRRLLWVATACFIVFNVSPSAFGRIIPFVLLLCCVSNDLSKGGNRRSNQFFSGCVLFDVFIYHLPQQLKYIVPNFNFTVKHIG